LDNLAKMKPQYLDSLENGSLERKRREAIERLSNCTLCPRRCQVDRINGNMGVCKTGKLAKVASYNAHFGEESPLVGENGSGTIFLSQCSLLCNFCQNYEISHQGEGVEVNDDQLASIMLELQRHGCHNINFVTPSHVVPQILSAVFVAAKKGLEIPLVYNSSGYDAVETLQLLDGIVDIYMPDFKFWEPEVAQKACDALDYPEVARAALMEMHRQVGDLEIDEQSGLAYRGLLVRHLVLPSGMAGTAKIMKFIAQQISANTYVNVMSQYRPCGMASEIPELAVSLTSTEYDRAVRETHVAGIQRLDRPRRVFELW
jgi:putative pyruvate formate lyase activating enzyme